MSSKKGNGCQTPRDRKSRKSNTILVYTPTTANRKIAELTNERQELLEFRSVENPELASIEKSLADTQTLLADRNRELAEVKAEKEELAKELATSQEALEALECNHDLAIFRLRREMERKDTEIIGLRKDKEDFEYRLKILESQKDRKIEEISSELLKFRGEVNMVTQSEAQNTADEVGHLRALLNIQTERGDALSHAYADCLNQLEEVKGQLDGVLADLQAWTPTIALPELKDNHYNEEILALISSLPRIPPCDWSEISAALTNDSVEADGDVTGERGVSEVIDTVWADLKASVEESKAAYKALDEEVASSLKEAWDAIRLLSQPVSNAAQDDSVLPESIVKVEASVIDLQIKNEVVECSGMTSYMSAQDFPDDTAALSIDTSELRLANENVLPRTHSNTLYDFAREFCEYLLENQVFHPDDVPPEDPTVFYFVLDRYLLLLDTYQNAREEFERKFKELEEQEAQAKIKTEALFLHLSQLNVSDSTLELTDDLRNSLAHDQSTLCQDTTAAVDDALSVLQDNVISMAQKNIINAQNDTVSILQDDTVGPDFTMSILQETIPEQDARDPLHLTLLQTPTPTPARHDRSSNNASRIARLVTPRYTSATPNTNRSQRAKGTPLPSRSLNKNGTPFTRTINCETPVSRPISRTETPVSRAMSRNVTSTAKKSVTFRSPLLARAIEGVDFEALKESLEQKTSALENMEKTLEARLQKIRDLESQVDELEKFLAEAQTHKNDAEGELRKSQADEMEKQLLSVKNKLIVEVLNVDGQLEQRVKGLPPAQVVSVLLDSINARFEKKQLADQYQFEKEREEWSNEIMKATKDTEAERVQMKQKIVKLEASIKELEEQRRPLADKLDELEISVVTLQDELTQSQEESKELVKQFEQKMADKEVQLNLLEEQIKHLESTVRQLEDNLEALTAEKSLLETRVGTQNDFSAEMESLKLALDASQQEKHELRTKLTEVTEKNELSEGKVAELIERNIDLSKKSAELELQISEKVEQVKVIEVQKNELETKLAENQVAMKSVEDELAKLQKMITQKIEALALCNELKDLLELQVDHAEKELKSSEEQKNSLELQLTEKKNEMKLLEAQKAEVESKLTSLDQMVDELLAKYTSDAIRDSDVRDKLNRVPEYIQAHIDESKLHETLLNSSPQEKEKLQNSCESEKEEAVVKLQNDVRNGENLISSLRQDLEKSQEMLASVQKELENRNKEIETLKIEAEHHHSKITKMDAEMKTCGVEAEIMKSDVLQKKAEVEKLQNEAQARETEVSRLQNVVEAHENEIKRLLSDVENRETEISRLLSEVQSHETEVTTIKTASETEIVKLRNEAKNYEDEVAKLTAEIANREEQLTKLQCESDDHKTDISRLQSEVELHESEVQKLQEKLQDQVAKLEAEIMQHHLEISGLKQQLVDSMSKEDCMSKTEETVEKLKAENANLEKNLEEKQTELNAKLNQLEDGKKESEELQEKISVILKEKIVLEEILTEKDSQIADLSALKVELSTQLEDLTKAKTVSDESLADCKTQIADLTVKVKEAEANDVALRAEIHDKNEEARKYESEVENLMAKLREVVANGAQNDVLQEQIAKLTKEKSVIEQSLKGKAGLIEELKTKLTAEANELARLRENVTTLCDEKASLERSLADKESQIEALSEKSNGEATEIGQLREKVTAIGEEKALLEQRLEEKESQADEFKAKLCELTAQLCELSSVTANGASEAEELRKTIDVVSSEKTSLEQSLAGKESQISELTAKLSELTAQMGEISAKTASDVENLQKTVETVFSEKNSLEQSVAEKESQINELTAKFAELTTKSSAEVAQLQERVAVINEEKTSLEEKLLAKESEIKDLLAKVSDGGNEATQLRETVAVLSAEKTIMEKCLEEKESQVEDLKLRLSELQSVHDDVLVNVERLGTCINNLEAEAARYLQDKKNVDLMLEQSRQRVKELEREHEEHLEAMKGVKNDQAKQLSQLNADHGQEVRTLSDANAQLTALLTDIQQTLELPESSVSNLRNKTDCRAYLRLVKDQHQQQQNLTVQLEKLSNEKIHFEIQAAELRAFGDSQKEQIETLTDKLGKLEERLSKKAGKTESIGSRRMEKLEEMNGTLQDVLTQLLNILEMSGTSKIRLISLRDIEHATPLIMQHAGKCAAALKKTQELHDQISELDKENQELSDTVEALLKDNSELESKILKLEGSGVSSTTTECLLCRKANETVSKLESQVLDLTSKMKTMDEENEELSNTVEQLFATNRSLETQVLELQTAKSMTAHCTECAKMKNRLQEEQSHCSKLKQQLKQHADDVSRINQRCEDLEKQLSCKEEQLLRKFHSIPGTAVTRESEQGEKIRTLTNEKNMLKDLLRQRLATIKNLEAKISEQAPKTYNANSMDSPIRESLGGLYNLRTRSRDVKKSSRNKVAPAGMVQDQENVAI